MPEPSVPRPGGRRSLPDPGFAGDLGLADADLRVALAACAQDPRRQPEVLLALQDQRLLVPVVAVLDEAEGGEDGLRREKSSDMATALLTGRDGRLALLAFTGLDSLSAWRGDARPVAVTTALAARSAVQEGAAALVVDVAGPASYVVEGEVLDRLARGWRLVPVAGGLAWAEPSDAEHPAAQPEE